LSRQIAAPVAVQASAYFRFRRGFSGCCRLVASFTGAVVLVSHDEGAVLALNPERVLILPDGTEDHWSDQYADLISLS
jgi:hypothetical protein